MCSAWSLTFSMFLLLPHLEVCKQKGHITWIWMHGLSAQGCQMWPVCSALELLFWINHKIFKALKLGKPMFSSLFWFLFLIILIQDLHFFSLKIYAHTAAIAQWKEQHHPLCDWGRNQAVSYLHSLTSWNSHIFTLETHSEGTISVRQHGQK